DAFSGVDKVKGLFGASADDKTKNIAQEEYDRKAKGGKLSAMQAKYFSEQGIKVDQSLVTPTAKGAVTSPLGAPVINKDKASETDSATLLATNALEKALQDNTEATKDQSSAMGAAGSQIWNSVKEAGKTAASKVTEGYKQGGITGAVQAIPEAGKAAYGSLSSGLAVSKGLAVGHYTKDEQASIEAAQGKGEKFKAGKGLGDDTKAQIADTAKKYGIPADQLNAMIQMESGG